MNVRRALRSCCFLATLATGAATLGTVVACSGGPNIVTPEQAPENPTTVETPQSHLSVTATLAAATLGDDCGGNGPSASKGAGISADCAELPDGGGCGGSFVCQQSNMQLTFQAKGDASFVAASAKIQIVAVRLLLESDASVLDDLTAREPSVWNGSSYATWNETITAGQSLKTSYKLSAPDWATIGNGKSWNTYSQKYLLEVVLTIDGVTRTLRSNAEIYRDPMVAT
jgi:hypothetical protein